MSGNDVYDIYDDAGFDADGLEAASIYDDDSIIEPPKQSQSHAPTQEVKNISKAPEVRKEVKVPPPNQKSVKQVDNSLQPRDFIASKSQNISTGGTSAIHIQNLPWWISEDDIRSKLSTIVSSNDITQIVFQEYKVNGKSRGLAYVEFKEVNISNQAKEGLDNKAFEDRPCSTCYVQPTPTPFQRNMNANARQFQNGQEVSGSHFSAPGNRMRGKAFNQRPGNFANPIPGMNQPFLNSGMANFNTNGNFPGRPQIQNFPGIRNQQNSAGLVPSQSHSSRNNRNNHSLPGHHSSNSNKRSNGNESSRTTSRRRHD